MGERVVVAMSGGVDSSMAAALLVEQGYEVVGIMLRLWSEPVLELPGSRETPGTTAANRCCTVEAVRVARSVAERLEVPFYLINVEELFRRAVVEPFIQGYSVGQTPNPCLACNRQVRFGYLLKYARALGARYLATGHYARVQQGPDGKFELWRGVDPAKDQSYVLSVLGQEELAHALFPLGGYTKQQVRAMATARGLPAAERAESQDLCFVADGDYRRFLRSWAPEAIRPGPILDRQGHQLGTHKGLPFYTIGQREGLGVAVGRPLYVLALDRQRNALIVGSREELACHWLRTGRVNWISGELPSGLLPVEVQIRYRAMPVPAMVEPLPDGCSRVHFVTAVRGITPGQAAVFYEGDRCLGGGLIEESGHDA